jgi:hypothetical protein
MIKETQATRRTLILRARFFRLNRPEVLEMFFQSCSLNVRVLMLSFYFLHELNDPLVRLITGKNY